MAKRLRKIAQSGITITDQKPLTASAWKFDADNFTDLIKKREKKKFVIALSAGKLKIACHLPLLRLMETLEMKVDELWGVSAGAIVGGLWSHGVSAKQIYDFLDEISIAAIFDVFNVHAMLLALDAFRHDEKLKTAGLIPGMKIEDLLRSILENPDLVNTYIDPANFYAVAYNMSKFHKTVLSMNDNGKVKHLNMNNAEEAFTESESSGDLADILRASIAMSGIYWPKQIGKDYFLDGGIAEHLPIRSPFVRWHNDVASGREHRDLLIVALEAAYWSKNVQLPANPFHIVSESFEILGVELSRDHEYFIRNYRSPKKPKVELIIIRPELPYTKINKLPDFREHIKVAKKAIVKSLSNK